MCEESGGRTGERAMKRGMCLPVPRFGSGDWEVGRLTHFGLAGNFISITEVQSRVKCGGILYLLISGVFHITVVYTLQHQMGT